VFRKDTHDVKAVVRFVVFVHSCSFLRFTMKIISFVAASSNSGKTTLIEKVVRVLKQRGLRVAVVKHAPEGFDSDLRGKDSRRFREAGADAVLLVGPDAVALERRTPGPPGPEQMRQLVGEVDLVLREGFKEEGGDRVEVFRSGVSGEQPLCMRDRTFLALVSDVPFACGIPWYHLDDVKGVADLIVPNYD
jgi:molybdopterin-guanine dinucleotide biosynthesis protein B